MASLGSTVSRRRDASPPSGGEPRSPLRLTVARGTLGLELYEPFELGPLSVERLHASLPNLRFPVDLSGGVPAFRHRRGKLEHIEFRLAFEPFSKWMERRLRDVLGGLARPPSVWSVDEGIGLGLVGAAGALAFDLIWAPVEGNARFIVARPRSARSDGIALATALHVVDTLFTRIGERTGRIFTIPNAGPLAARAVLPALGARAPSVDAVRFSPVQRSGDAASVALDSDFDPPPFGSVAARSLELGTTTRDADEALSQGRLEEAREKYLYALERAPRHPEIVRVVAEMDARVGHRAEAALALVAESQPVDRGGAVVAELLARVGDLASARAALRQAATTEEFAPLGALWWTDLARLEGAMPARLDALDEAVARSPALGASRWARLEARLHAGNVDGALADAEHLEAAESGARRRHDVCRRAAQAMSDAGFVRQAGRMFERALRYVPDDPLATAGLGRALIDVGRHERAVALLERAIDLASDGDPPVPALMDLARVLAERFADLPQAIARVREIPSSSPEALEARALEARWRARLGDVAGASLAFAKLREAIELDTPAEPRRAAEWLVEAAEFARNMLDDAAECEQYLALAVRLRPQDRRLGDLYRDAAGALARTRRARLET